MANNPDIAPQDDVLSSDAEEKGILKGNKRKSFSNLRRELKEDELNAPAVKKLLIDEIERLERENNNLLDYQDKYHSADKSKAVLEQKLKTHLSQDIVSGGCMTVGAAALGYAPSLWSNQPTGIITIIFGCILILCGIIAKAVKS